MSYIGGLVQGCGISSADALEIQQSCANPSNPHLELTDDLKDSKSQDMTSKITKFTKIGIDGWIRIMQVWVYVII